MLLPRRANVAELIPPIAFVHSIRPTGKLNTLWLRMQGRVHIPSFFISYSAIVEHTRQVIYLEDDDVAFVEDGALSIHRIKRDGDGLPNEQTREVKNKFKKIFKKKIVGSTSHNGIATNYARGLQDVHAKGNIRTTRVSSEHNAWTSARGWTHCTWWNQSKLFNNPHVLIFIICIY